MRKFFTFFIIENPETGAFMDTDGVVRDRDQAENYLPCLRRNTDGDKLSEGLAYREITPREAAALIYQYNTKKTIIHDPIIERLVATQKTLGSGARALDEKRRKIAHLEQWNTTGDSEKTHTKHCVLRDLQGDYERLESSLAFAEFPFIINPDDYKDEQEARS